MKLAAEAYINEHPEYMTIRFDIISICMDKDKVSDITHFEDAFY